MSKKISISIIGTKGYPFVYGGYETFVKNLSERLVSRNYDVIIYCHSSLFKTKPKQVKGVKLKYIPSIETKSLSQFTHSFLSIIHASVSKTDIIFVVNSANGPFGLITKMFRKPSLINVDGMEWLRPKWKGLGSIYFKWASKMATIFYDQIINDCEEMKKVYMKLFKTDSKVIAYGSNVIKPSKCSKIDRWGLESKKFYLVVGRLIPDNNADLIINGFIKSKSMKKLVIVGNSPFKDSYSLNVKKQDDDRIVFTGKISDPKILSDLYHNCYVYIHGHEFGGTNPTMIKAIRYGCAIIALKTVFNCEMLCNGKYGLLFKKETSKITEMINFCDTQVQIVNRLRTKSKKGIKNKYDWDFITTQYEQVFNDLLN